MKPPNYILLTATISVPTGMGASVRVDPAARLQEYLKSFEYYWSLPDDVVDGIILTENSGHDFEAFHEICRRIPRRKEFLPVSTSTDYPADKGKGYGEFYMLDQALAQLRRQGLPGHARLWKSTGRLKIGNMVEMIRTAPEAFSLYGDFRRVPLVGRRLGGNEWLELRLVATTLDGYDRHFRGHYGDGYVIEWAFFDRLYPAFRSGDRTICPRFLRQPQYIGYSGWSNQNYSGFRYRVKDSLRRTLRRVAPGFWL